MSQRGRSGKGGNHGHGQGSGGGRGSGRGMGRRGGRNRVVGQGAPLGADAEAHSRQIEPTPHLQHAGNPVPRMSMPASAAKEIELLIYQAEAVREQLQSIYARISVMQAEVNSGSIAVTDGLRRKGTAATGEVAAVIDREKCVNCGICAGVCPVGAIAVGEATVVDFQKCTGCGACVDECPNDAICLATLNEVPCT